MAEDAPSIDTAPVDALLQIKKKQEELQELVARAEGTRAKVSEAVFKRVSEDYASRLRSLEAEARPLRSKARQEHGRLAPMHERLRRQVEEAQLDKEELEFRHEVGELGDEEFTRRSKAAEEVLSRRRQEFAEADDLKNRFVAVMGPPEADADVRREPAAYAPAPNPQPMMDAAVAAPPGPPETSLPPEPEVVHEEETGMLAEATLSGRPADLEESEGGTLTMRLARLVTEGTQPPEEFQLGPRTSIGRTADNDITIPHASVSRHHAVVMLADNGYAIEDLKSGNGTYVNDERVEHRALASGDRIKIGTTLFVFRQPED